MTEFRTERVAVGASSQIGQTMLPRLASAYVAYRIGREDRSPLRDYDSRI